MVPEMVSGTLCLKIIQETDKYSSTVFYLCQRLLLSDMGADSVLFLFCFLTLTVCDNQAGGTHISVK